MIQGTTLDSHPENAPSVPERPQLAEGVELMGEMVESAFKEPPWLISRNGKFLQVTELLHCIAEQATGDKTVEDMASAASANYERPLEAGEVAQLIATNLIPAGIIRAADGAVVPQSADGPSPLAVNMKIKMLPPALIEAFTQFLKILYMPPVLLALLGAAFASQYWIFFVHGLGTSINEAFFSSGMMLAVLAMIIGAAAFHEFGHAAALRYGGGRVAGMGAGIYIVYPAFYTDVTDNYRLPRWSRVRTDLGGFYFNLVFGLALTGIYFLTGEEVFLIGVLLIDIEIVHQLLPFVRLDGYWALADISGIPDFFSQIGPFMRSQLPSWVPFPSGRALPPLKTSAKLFFIFYISVTVPILAALFFLVFRALPRIIATGASAVAEQLEKLPEAATNGDVLTVLAAGLQAILLILPSIGLCYLFYKLARKFLSLAWGGADASLPRRAGGALATAGAVLLLAFLWLPQLPMPVDRPQVAIGSVPIEAGRFEPIRPQERLAVQDAFTGATRPALPNQVEPEDPAPASTPGATQSATPGATSTAQPGSGPPSGTTPLPIVTPPARPAAAATPSAGTTATPAATQTNATPVATTTGSSPP